MILALISALIGAYLTYTIVSNKIRNKVKEDVDSLIERLSYEHFMECEELREEQRRKDEQLRITEAQLGAIKQHRINPEDYVTKTQYETLTNEYLTLKQVRDKLVSEQKSKEVRLGAIAETLAPFLDGFPYDPKKLRALGSPIDYIAFEDDCVVLIEIKSGDSKLNKNQKNIKDIVESGNVRFETYRIDKDGVHGD